MVIGWYNHHLIEDRGVQKHGKRSFVFFQWHSNLVNSHKEVIFGFGKSRAKPRLVQIESWGWNCAYPDTLADCGWTISWTGHSHQSPIKMSTGTKELFKICRKLDFFEAVCGCQCDLHICGVPGAAPQREPLLDGTGWSEGGGSVVSMNQRSSFRDRLRCGPCLHTVQLLPQREEEEEQQSTTAHWTKTTQKTIAMINWSFLSHSWYWCMYVDW